MNRKLITLLLALTMIVSLAVSASAAETKEARVPVTLTVVNAVSPISCTSVTVYFTVLISAVRKMRSANIFLKFASPTNVRSSEMPFHENRLYTRDETFGSIKKTP